jgi:hypothetical protein
MGRRPRCRPDECKAAKRLGLSDGTGAHMSRFSRPCSKPMFLYWKVDFVFLGVYRGPGIGALAIGTRLGKPQGTA